MSNKLNLEVKQGEDFVRVLTIKDELGAPIDLTGFVFAGSIRKDSTSDVFLDFTFTVKNQATDQGKVEMKLPSGVSSRKKVSQIQSFLYDVEMNTGSEVKRILQGVLTFDPEMTK